MGQKAVAKCKQCRREGEKLFLKGERCFTSKCAIVKRNYPPGHVGARGARRRLTGYGTQLREKQKAKRMYGIMERQFRSYFEEAKSKQGQTGDVMIELLEKRLDNVVYRAGFAASRSQARQLVSHAQFTVNGRKVDVPSIQVKAGDVIEVKESKRSSEFWSKLGENTTHVGELPDWVTADKKNLKIEVKSLPESAKIDTDIQMHLIVELYSL